MGREVVEWEGAKVGPLPAAGSPLLDAHSLDSVPTSSASTTSIKPSREESRDLSWTMKYNTTPEPPTRTTRGQSEIEIEIGRGSCVGALCQHCPCVAIVSVCGNSVRVWQ
jgi:hypothetical protein